MEPLFVAEWKYDKKTIYELNTIIYHFIYVLDNPAFLFQYRHRSGLYPNLDLCLYFLI